MREILFRGKIKYNGNHYFSGDWIYGFYFENGAGEGFIVDTSPDNFGNIMFAKIQVDPETVGQYIGLKDNKRTKEYPEGQMIFEGDISKYNYVIKYNKQKALFAEHDRERGFIMSYPIDASGVKIIGNIHEEITC
jgi:hypothetical protein